MTTTPTLWGSEVTFLAGPLSLSDINSLAFSPDIAGLADNSFVMVWRDTSAELFGYQFDELGGLASGNFLSATSAATPQGLYTPKVFQQLDGQVIVNFNLSFAPGDSDIYGNFLNPDYSPNQFKYSIESSAADEYLLDAAATIVSSSGFFFAGSAIVYQVPQPFNGVSTQWDLVLRLLGPTGLPASNQIFIDHDPNETKTDASVIGLEGGNTLVAYQAFTSSAGGGSFVRYHVYSPDGSDLTGVQPANATPGDDYYPEVAALSGTGAFVIVTQDSLGLRYLFKDGADEIYASVPGSVVATPHFLDQFYNHKVTALTDGGFIIAWDMSVGQEEDDSPDLGLVLQRFGPDGFPVGENLHIDHPGDQVLQSIATLDDGRVIVTFQDETGDSTNLFTLDYQVVDPRGDTILGGNGPDNIVGREEATLISGLDDADRLTGRGGSDTLNGGAGPDVLKGFGGGDQLIGRAGADNFDGGLGFDTVSYATSGSGVNVNLLVPSGNGGGAAGDIYASIERILGSDHNDVLRGRAGTDVLIGGSGGDTFLIQPGCDIDRVEDHAMGVDTIRLLSFTGIDSLTDLQARGIDNGVDSSYNLGNGDSLVIVGHNVGDLQSGDFLFA
jgi:Ca2+-binding RTX toxin-like protein